MPRASSVESDQVLQALGGGLQDSKQGRGYVADTLDAEKQKCAAATPS